jgi:hypothetical protein
MQTSKAARIIGNACPFVKTKLHYESTQGKNHHE